MKKTILTTVLSIILTTTLAIATEVETKPKIDHMAEIMKMDQEIKNMKAQTEAEKKETESLTRLGKKLDELQDVLTKKKTQHKE